MCVQAIEISLKFEAIIKNGLGFSLFLSNIAYIYI